MAGPKHAGIGAYVALTMCLAHPAAAQGVRSGRLTGTVADSVHGGHALVGVRVIAVGTESPDRMRGTAITGTDGGFVIDSLPAGTYMVGFESALLDSLEIVPPPHAVTVEPGRAAVVKLALPAATTLRAAVCPKVTLPPGTGAIYGRVVDADTENPLGHITIALAWRELDVDRKTLRPMQSTRAASAVTDGGGWYVACGVPTGAWVEMQLQHDERVGTIIRTFVDDTLGIAIRHLSFSPSESRVDADTGVVPAERVGAVALPGTAALSGRVLGPMDQPVALAEVRVRGAAAETRTDSTGRYSLGQLPAGTQILDVRRFGYDVAATQVELRSGVVTTKDVRLQRFVATLDTMRAVAVRSRYPEFQRRREHAFSGYFLGPEELMRMNVTYTNEIIRKIPGMRVLGFGPRARVSSYHGPAGTVCPPNVVVNDAEHWEIGDVNPKDIGAMEIYPPGHFAPWMYDQGCGTIIIWTKRQSVPRN